MLLNRRSHNETSYNTLWYWIKWEKTHRKNNRSSLLGGAPSTRINEVFLLNVIAYQIRRFSYGSAHSVDTAARWIIYIIIASVFVFFNYFGKKLKFSLFSDKINLFSGKDLDRHVEIRQPWLYGFFLILLAFQALSPIF